MQNGNIAMGAFDARGDGLYSARLGSFVVFENKFRKVSKPEEGPNFWRWCQIWRGVE